MGIGSTRDWAIARVGEPFPRRNAAATSLRGFPEDDVNHDLFEPMASC